jgi:glycosyltransferase involved in cell wall biosynthesis
MDYHSVKRTKRLRLGIDASNLQEGGGVTHLVEFLRAAQPSAYGIDHVVVWGKEQTLRLLPKESWLRITTDRLLNQQLGSQLFWQKYRLPGIARQNCDILFVPGGISLGNFHPFVIMNRNMLPFEQAEYRRFGTSWMFLKMNLLRFGQTASIREANGMIFLNKYARTVVMQHAKKLKGNWTIIPHGVNPNFRFSPRPARPTASYSQTSPFRLLYISNVLPYKHQWNVAKAVHALRQAGFWVELDLVGSAYPPSLQRLQKVIQLIDADEQYIHYHGAIPYGELPRWYQRADGFVFASSCESFGFPLIEGMAAGLPIACSNRGPMPGFLGDAGIYFDPEQPESIVEALTSLIQDTTWREEHALIAYTRSLDYSWERCAQETLDFIVQTARKYYASRESG